jgi:hypothetical protein
MAKELSAPPGKVVWWTFLVRGTTYHDVRYVRAKTAFDACALEGVLLSQVANINWSEDEPIRVGMA